ncbi:hypothetical protein CFP56_002065 [Quercus suber]|uniref:Uncharacterized protein n=1 Tax=Quercus suber TaxID=58331 RepID=A0AAW0M8X2_QUESU
MTMKYYDIGFSVEFTNSSGEKSMLRYKVDCIPPVVEPVQSDDSYSVPSSGFATIVSVKNLVICLKTLILVDCHVLKMRWYLVSLLNTTYLLDRWRWMRRHVGLLLRKEDVAVVHDTTFPEYTATHRVLWHIVLYIFALIFIALLS